MTDPIAVPLVVASISRDPVEALNSLLRRNGVPAHCTWISSMPELPEALAQLNPEMLLGVVHDEVPVALLAEIRDRSAAEVPLLTIRSVLDEALIHADMKAGARDVVNLTHPERLFAVFARELHAARVERALNKTLHSVQDYRNQLETVLTRSTDAILEVQEGIVVHANGAWRELAGDDSAEGPVGQPVMDLFDSADHAALKGALNACLQGRWTDQMLRVQLTLPDQSSKSLEVALANGERDNEASIRLIVPAQRPDDQHLAEELAEAIRRNPRTGLWYRQPLLETIRTRVAAPPLGGSRFIVSLKPDDFEKHEQTLGVFDSEELISALSNQVREQTMPNDVIGHFSGPTLLALIERGTAKDAENWTDQVLHRVHEDIFGLRGQKLRVTLSAGLATLPKSPAQLEETISRALEAARRSVQRGGNQWQRQDKSDTDTRVQAYDGIWVKHIQSALEEKRFKLVHQPVMGLATSDQQMFDMLVRMVDHQGKDILPSEFMPPAERNDLASDIDRWVLEAAAKFAVKRNLSCVLARVSRFSVLDKNFLPWLTELKSRVRIAPRQLCLQLPESFAAASQREVLRLKDELKKLEIRLAIEHFGTQAESISLLAALSPDFVKIDGSLMQGIAHDEALQDKVRQLARAALAAKVSTIAERVEDTNTMAVLWQLGVQHLQGFLFQSTENVVLDAR